MSNEAYNWARKLHPGPGPKSVLLSLADRASDHSGEDWTCFPSIMKIVEDTDYSRPTVERHLKTLWREGIISRARRRRADGKLGIYDYTLHRCAERRAGLKAAREAVQDVDAAMEMVAPEAEAPHVNLTCGPGVNLDGATHQIDGQPYVKLMGQEPSVEPSLNPHSGGAREPGSQGFDEAVGLWPESGRKRTSWPQGRAAWAWACTLETPERLLAAVKACAADPDLAKGDHGWPGLHGWLSGERWRVFLPKGLAEGGGAPTWAGPEGLWTAVVAERGEKLARMLLVERTRVEGRRVVCASGAAFRELSKLAGIFEQHGCELVAPNGGG